MITTSTAHEVTKPMNCLLYLRVSGESQIDNFSLDTQLDICNAYAKREGFNVLKVFREEGQSAMTANRPELVNLLEYCRVNKSNISSVVVYKIDRMARQTSDYLAIKKQLAEYGIKLLSTSEPTGTNPVDNFIETIFASVAQLDNQVRGERAKNGLYKRFLSGYHVSKPPIGYKSEKDETGRSVAVPDENFEAIKKAWHLVATGTKTLRDMQVIMNEWGVKASWKGSKKLGLQTVADIFKNKFYCGVITSSKYPEREVAGKHLPMITEQLYYTVRGLLDGRIQQPVASKRIIKNDQFPLKGIVKHTCGYNLVGANCKGRHKYYPTYWCAKHPSPSISVEKVDKQLEEMLKGLQPNQDAINLFTLILHDEYHNRLEVLKKSQQLADKKILEAKALLTSLVEGHMKKLYSDEIFLEQKAKLETQLLASNVVKNDNLCGQYDIEAITKFVKALLYDINKAYEVSDTAQKKILLGSIFPEGLVYDGGQLLNRSISPIFDTIRHSTTPQYAYVEIGR